MSVGCDFQLCLRRALPRPNHLVVPEHVLAGGKLLGLWAAHGFYFKYILMEMSYLLCLSCVTVTWGAPSGELEKPVSGGKGLALTARRGRVPRGAEAFF